MGVLGRRTLGSNQAVVRSIAVMDSPCPVKLTETLRKVILEQSRN